MSEDVQTVGTELTLSERLGACKARWAIGRMDYRVAPGLYAVGRPDADSVVLVTANYKLSFDRLRQELGGLHVWILVLDTDGINVWCAAGKGSFGTDEIVRQVQSTGLAERVNHRRLVLPQLGAPGVSAHQVKQRCGFRVVYGPVRAADLKAFLDNRMKATAEMRRVRFDLADRLAVAPVELMMGLVPALVLAAVFVGLAGLGPDGYALSRLLGRGLISAGVVLGAFVLAVVLGAALLPWLPGRAFATKGAGLGLLLAGALFGLETFVPGHFGDGLALAGWSLLLPVLASFVVMGFTGASTFTSLSGVKREVRVAVPAQLSGLAAGLGLWITGLFV